MWRAEEDKFSVPYAGLAGAFQPKLGHQSGLKMHKKNSSVLVLKPKLLNF